jgi:HEPN domain-containing protein
MSRARALGSDLKLAAECLRDARVLLSASSRNAAYLASQAAEHVIRAVATSEGLHIERRLAHQLDTIVRLIPEDNPDRPALQRIAFLEAFATAYRYPTPAGRLSPAPDAAAIENALQIIEGLLRTLAAHFGVDLAEGTPALNIAPRRRPA